MGYIDITTAGSFPSRNRQFPAMNHGHAHAVAEAIAWRARADGSVARCRGRSDAADSWVMERSKASRVSVIHIRLPALALGAVADHVVPAASRYRLALYVGLVAVGVGDDPVDLPECEHQRQVIEQERGYQSEAPGLKSAAKGPANLKAMYE